MFMSYIALEQSRRSLGASTGASWRLYSFLIVALIFDIQTVADADISLDGFSRPTF
jgi:hypothetical protein